MPLGSDDALIRAWSAADHSAAREVARRYGPVAYRLACTVGLDRHTAVEAVVTGFATAGQRVAALGGSSDRSAAPAVSEPSGQAESAEQLEKAEQAGLPQLRSWLFSVLTRCLRDQRDDRGRHLPAPAVLPLGDELKVGLDRLPWPVTQAELVRMTWCAAQQLGPGQRDLIGLQAQVGLDVDELSRIAGRSTTSISAELGAVLDQVRQGVAALLVARIAGPPCAGLLHVVAQWDGRFTPQYATGVGDHVTGCGTCRSRAALLRADLERVGPALPIFTPPADLTDRLNTVLTTGQSRPGAGSGTGSDTGPAGWGWRSDGYPSDTLPAAFPTAVGHGAALVHDQDPRPTPGPGRTLDRRAIAEPQTPPLPQTVPEPPPNLTTATPATTSTAAALATHAGRIDRPEVPRTTGPDGQGIAAARTGQVGRGRGQVGADGHGTSDSARKSRAGGRGPAAVMALGLILGGLWLWASQSPVSRSGPAPRVGAQASLTGSPGSAGRAGQTSTVPVGQGSRTDATGAGTSAPAAGTGASGPGQTGTGPGAEATSGGAALPKVAIQPDTVYTSAQCGPVTSRIVATSTGLTGSAGSAGSVVDAQLSWPGGRAAMRLRANRLVGIAGPFSTPGTTTLTVTVNNTGHGTTVATVAIRVLFCGS